MSGESPGRRAALLVVLVAAAAPAFGQNLAPNGEFDDNVLGWVQSGVGTLAWTAEDHDGCLASGSAEMTNAQPGTLDFYLLVCAPGVVPEQVYSAGADFNFPVGQATSGSAKLELRFYEDPNCAGSAIGFFPTPAVDSTSPSIWQRSEWLAALAPPASQAVLIGIVVHKDAAGSLVALVDGVFVVSGAGRLFDDSFEAGASCRWSAEGP